MKREVKYSIDEELPVYYQDAGPWRSYHIDASGDSLQELIKEAHICEVDQDGDTLRYYPLEDASNKVHEAAMRVLVKGFN